MSGLAFEGGQLGLKLLNVFVLIFDFLLIIVIIFQPFQRLFAGGDEFLVGIKFLFQTILYQVQNGFFVTFHIRRRILGAFPVFFQRFVVFLLRNISLRKMFTKLVNGIFIFGH